MKSIECLGVVPKLDNPNGGVCGGTLNALCGLRDFGESLGAFRNIAGDALNGVSSGCHIEFRLP